MKVPYKTHYQKGSKAGEPTTVSRYVVYRKVKIGNYKLFYENKKDAMAKLKKLNEKKKNGELEDITGKLRVGRDCEKGFSIVESKSGELSKHEATKKLQKLLGTMKEVQVKKRK